MVISESYAMSINTYAAGPKSLALNVKVKVTLKVTYTIKVICVYVPQEST